MEISNKEQILQYKEDFDSCESLKHDIYSESSLGSNFPIHGPTCYIVWFFCKTCSKSGKVRFV